MKIKKILLFICLFFGFNKSWEIELQTNDASVLRVGVVDINKVISEFPKAQKAQQEIELFKQNKLSELTPTEKELEELLRQKLNLNTEIDQLKHQLKQIEQELQISTSALQPLQFSTFSSISDEKLTKIQQIKEEITKKQKNLDQIDLSINEKKEKIKNEKEKIEKDVEEKKYKYEVEIYTELYKIIQKISQQEKLNLVIEKSGILYGEPQIDITQKVLDYIKKLKEE
ncbi:MAG: OmpH family outer membrane protein [Endomicrobiia bacterium]